MNYAFTTHNPLPIVKDGHTFRYDNFTQKEPHTKIFEGLSGLTFINCALLNCDVPPDATLISCSNGHASFCSHSHPKWLEKGVLAECPEDCQHLVSTDTISIDGVVLDTVKYYSDKGVAS